MRLEHNFPRPPQGKSGWPWTEGVSPDAATLPNGSPYPKISIVTPSYNQGQFIEETIRSVLLQGYPNLEYIVIDGQSSDHTLEILQRYQAHFSYWVSEPDDGPADAIRKGWNHATGEIIAYLNSDDAYLPGTLHTVAKSFQASPDIAMLCGNELQVDEHGMVCDQSTVTAVDYTSLLNLHFIPQPSVFVKRDVVQHVCGINPAIRYTFDFELWLRITRCFPVQCVPEVLSMTRWHENTITLKQRLNIGQELVDIVTHEIRMNPRQLSRQEQRHILCRAHRLVMTLYLEQRNLMQATRSALRAIAFSPDYRAFQKTCRKYYNRLTSPPKQGLPATPTTMHWSQFRNDNL